MATAFPPLESYRYPLHISDMSVLDAAAAKAIGGVALERWESCRCPLHVRYISGLDATAAKAIGGVALERHICSAVSRADIPIPITIAIHYYYHYSLLLLVQHSSSAYAALYREPILLVREGLVLGALFLGPCSWGCGRGAAARPVGIWSRYLGGQSGAGFFSCARAAHVRMGEEQEGVGRVSFSSCFAVITTRRRLLGASRRRRRRRKRNRKRKRCSGSFELKR